MEPLAKAKNLSALDGRLDRRALLRGFSRQLGHMMKTSFSCCRFETQCYDLNEYRVYILTDLFTIGNSATEFNHGRLGGGWLLTSRAHVWRACSMGVT